MVPKGRAPFDVMKAVVAVALAVAAVLTGTSRAATQRAQNVDLHKVNWSDVTLPGSVCGASNPIRLRDRRAPVRSTRWPRWPNVHVYSGWTRVIYGDLDADGTDEAALAVSCDNGGGTAAGVLAYSEVIFTAGAHTPRVRGVVTPRTRNPDEPASLIQVTIRPGKVVAHEYWYGPHDGTCCPSGRSTTVWTYIHGELVAGKTTVTKKPAK
jgi:hypothetical protein